MALEISEDWKASATSYSGSSLRLDVPPIAAASTIAILVIHSCFRFSPALDALYILPIWWCVRTFGVGVAIVFDVALFGVLAVGSSRSDFAEPPILIVATHLLSLSVFTAASARAELILAKLLRLAYSDPLTGLLNRHALREIANGIKDRTADARTIVSLDCDGLKSVNDRYGHAVGDHILQLLARTLRCETRDTDSLIRVGGDEFVLVLDSNSPEEARTVLVRVQNRFEQAVADAGYDCSISFGIAQAESSDEVDEVLAKADFAMYQQKTCKKSAGFLP